MNRGIDATSPSINTYLDPFIIQAGEDVRL